ncbi:acyl-CoA thioesterase [Anaerosacchariphilus polymeriproducens]|uniref:Acyl-CoA thioesterase n=1 Tax=Anaerosacchariphilus polymeriproducens TaxID=1812858 RepID=A0A371AWH5_9FIRM|nr:acyl-CoA thioesterase [Anaerosacchariphilus polymeriproducens]RDU23928.1 acyl-CoA thioesterase [Anaerosacchariphilus polymeriproducens]
MIIKPYERLAQYYETDQMKIIHHSNYIRWFEEARLNFLEQIGLNYDKMESNGIIIPVLSVNCEYRSMIRFAEIVLIQIKILSYNGIKMKIGYEIRDKKTNELKTIGETSHCFFNEEYQPISLKREYPEVNKIFQEIMNYN